MEILGVTRKIEYAGVIPVWLKYQFMAGNSKRLVSLEYSTCLIWETIYSHSNPSIRYRPYCIIKNIIK